MMHETFPLALAAMTGVFLVVAALLALSGSAWLFRGLPRAWPVLLAAVLYAAAFLMVPPPPLQVVVRAGGMTAWEALRYLALGFGLAYVSRDYYKVLCELDTLRKRA